MESVANGNRSKSRARGNEVEVEHPERPWWWWERRKPASQVVVVWV